MNLSRDMLGPLLIALDASPGALRRIDGDYRIDGKLGHIFAVSNHQFHVFVLSEKPETGLHDRWSKQGWTHCKRALSFMILNNDGDLEGSFLLNQLPNPEQATLIRKYCGIRQKVHYSDEVLAAMRSRMQGMRAASGQKTDET